MSNRSIRDFFQVNLLNLEYHINYPLKTFLLFNGFLAAMIIPLLMVDTFIKPILGYGPAQIRPPKDKEKKEKKAPGS